MMYNFRSVWPFRVTRRRSGVIDIFLAAIILPPMILLVVARAAFSSRAR